jgi:hypothetical protein
MTYDLAIPVRSLAAQRAAEALVRALGAGTVHVRVLLATVEPGDASQLGISGAATEDVQLSPVVLRQLSSQSKRDRARYELLFTPATLARARELGSTEAALEFLHRRHRRGARRKAAARGKLRCG